MIKYRSEACTKPTYPKLQACSKYILTLKHELYMIVYTL